MRGTGTGWSHLQWPRVAKYLSPSLVPQVYFQDCSQESQCCHPFTSEPCIQTPAQAPSQGRMAAKGTGCWAQPAGHGSSTPLLVGPQLAHAQSCAMSPHPRCGLRNSLEEIEGSGHTCQQSAACRSRSGTRAPGRQGNTVCRGTGQPRGKEQLRMPRGCPGDAVAVLHSMSGRICLLQGCTSQPLLPTGRHRWRAPRVLHTGACRAAVRKLPPARQGGQKPGRATPDTAPSPQ